MPTLTTNEIIAKARAEHDRIWAEAEAAARARRAQELADLADQWNPLVAAILADLPADLPVPAYQMPTYAPTCLDDGYDGSYQTLYRPLLLSFGDQISVLAYVVNDSVFWRSVELNEKGDTPLRPSLSIYELMESSRNIWLAINGSIKNLASNPVLPPSADPQTRRPAPPRSSSEGQRRLIHPSILGRLG